MLNVINLSALCLLCLQVFTYLLVLPYLITSFISTCLYIYVGFLIRKRMRQIGAAENNENRRLIQQKKVLFVQLLKPCCNFKMYHTHPIQCLVHQLPIFHVQSFLCCIYSLRITKYLTHKNVHCITCILFKFQVTKMMALVVVVYYALYLPGAIENFIEYDASVKFYINRLFNFLFFTNAVINPFIYGGQSREFNAAHRRILRLKIKYKLNLNRTNRTIKSKKVTIPTVSGNQLPRIQS